ncbi:MAG: universal stress protein [Pegethrix bostrychoides GSE-TBD4-15B]|jgi:nucleotide-binding universal stress UspA family protein|uniref:Universal stress protein n=1 Tax=Pegethrix bostrychoides GSE-TBD4-15B TaxID=2839662 RepID=A0A951P6C5_9CYAN|nr:universal stress protein [Pegethrix bostrychoides GSE-TBD4-15B]
MFQRLLICTSLADGMQRFVSFLPSLAANGIEQVTFLHVVPFEGRGIPHPDESEVQRAKEQLAIDPASQPANLEVKVEVQAGRPFERILETAKAERSDLVVLGTESRSLLTEKLFGSTAVSLCQSNKLPMLILRPQLISTYTVEELDLRCRHLFRYLLIPFDGSETAKRLLSTVKQRAQRSPQGLPQGLEECLLLCVIENNDRIDKIMHDSRIQAAEAQLAEAKAELEELNLKVTTRIEEGDRMSVTLDMAIDYDITAIAIATNSFGTLAELSSPSFTGELLRRSWHPVLFVPSA